jgi:hypothetical protein
MYKWQCLVLWHLTHHPEAVPDTAPMEPCAGRSSHRRGPWMGNIGTPDGHVKWGTAVNRRTSEVRGQL